MSKSKKGAKPEEKDIKINEEEEIIESETVETEEDSEQAEASEEVENTEEAAEDTEEEAEAESEEDAKEFVNLPFIEKCKKDPVIPVSLLLAFVMIIVAVVYFLLPAAKAPTMDMTLEEFENGFNQCDTTMYFFESGFDISIKKIEYIDRSANPGILGETETLFYSSSYVDHFTGHASVLYDAGLEGATRKTDGKLTHIRVYIAYDEGSSDEWVRVWMFFASTLQALYPDLTEFDAKAIALNAMSDYAGEGMYIKMGDIAFRWIPVKPGVGGHESGYIVIEAVPAKILSDEQIASTLEMPEPSESESAAVEASASET
ncbi:MAG: hypothetical protein IKF31_00505 [Clostridiales bacterium]|nr:hypothetical protein [Clostridiales bacterium]